MTFAHNRSLSKSFAPSFENKNPSVLMSGTAKHSKSSYRTAATAFPYRDIERSLLFPRETERPLLTLFLPLDRQLVVVNLEVQVLEGSAPSPMVDQASSGMVDC